MLKLIPLAVAGFVFVVVMFVRILTNDPSDGRFEKQAVVPNVLPPLVDARDGQSYGVVKIGDQVWMSENLNFGKMTTKKKLSPGTKWCYNDDKNACGDGFGGLYSWDVAQKSCPQGWHLPGFEEWKTMRRAIVGDSTLAGDKLRSRNGWSNYEEEADEGRSFVLVSGNGTDDYGFSALPSGAIDKNISKGKSRNAIVAERGLGAFFWAAETNAEGAFFVSLYYDKSGLFYSAAAKTVGMAVRCVKD